MSRLHELTRTTPPGTMGTIGLCLFCFLFQMVSDLPLHSVTLCPRRVLYNFEIYRIGTNAIFHFGWLHIGMNMMSMSAIGSMLEKRMGTLRLISIMIISMIVTALLHILAAWTLLALFGVKRFYYDHSIGFSAILFHLTVLESNLGSHENRSIFGFFEVPSYLYPWVLLVVLQLVLPNLSFVGHLSGILAGTLQLHGMLHFSIPKESTLRELEGRSCLRQLSAWPSFVPTTSEDSILSTNRPGQRILHAYASLRTWIMNIAETVKVMIFGQGRRINSNIRFGLWETSDSDYVDDNDWSGLPESRTDSTSEIV